MRFLLLLASAASLDGFAAGKAPETTGMSADFHTGATGARSLELWSPFEPLTTCPWFETHLCADWSAAAGDNAFTLLTPLEDYCTADFHLLYKDHADASRQYRYRAGEVVAFSSGMSFPHDVSDLDPGSPPLVFYELDGDRGDTLRVNRAGGRIVITY